VRRPFHRGNAAQEPVAAVSSGEAELAALEQAPGDQQLAVALARSLLARAEADGEFGNELAAWWEQASSIHVSGDVASMISGGTFHGPVLQGRDFTGLTFGSPAPPPASPEQKPGAL
jgi:hypothetical protein